MYRAYLLGEQPQRVARLDVVIKGSLREFDFRPVDVGQVLTALGGGSGEGAAQLSALVHGQTDPCDARGYAPSFLVALACFFLSECLLALRGSVNEPKHYRRSFVPSLVFCGLRLCQCNVLVGEEESLLFRQRLDQ